jgi:NitT/TauT family transport system ATP-binding protein
MGGASPLGTGTTERNAGAPVVEFNDVTVTYPGKHVTRPAVVGVDLSVAKGSFVCVVGPSGCGKSTLLHVCSGLLKISAGEFRYLGQEWGRLHPGIGYVTQRETLLPWKTVLGNIALPLKIKGVPRAERREKAADIATSVGLGDWLKRYPRELSGGMRQRVQLARTLITDPTLLLMDEPFGALDAVLRVRMQEFLKSTIAGTDLTTIFVTHDLTEALTLGDQVVAMAGSPGRIDQVDYLDDLPRGVSPLELRQAPAYAAHEFSLWKTIAGNLSADGRALSGDAPAGGDLADENASDGAGVSASHRNGSNA